jgi:hypothetical protein
MTYSNRVPEHKLRHRYGIGTINQVADSAPTMSWAERPLTESSLRSGSACEATPLAGAAVLRENQIGTSLLSLWRTVPADRFCAGDMVEISSVLDEIATVLEGSGYEPALYGDPDATIGLVLALMPIRTVGLRIDIAMTAVLRCALEGDLRAALVLVHIVDRADLHLSQAAELCTSWFEYYLRRSPSKGGLTRAEKAVVKALQERKWLHSHDGRVHR